MIELDNILGESSEFLDAIFKNLAIYGIDVSKFELDHICYRVATKNEYLSTKQNLLKIGNILVESDVNGREITTFKLNQPIVYQSRIITILELPSPKMNSHYESGFEHVEFVIDGNLEDFQLKYPKIDFDKKAMKKTFNRDLRISFGAISVKFHEQSLERVIEIEENNS